MRRQGSSKTARRTKSPICPWHRSVITSLCAGGWVTSMRRQLASGRLNASGALDHGIFLMASKSGHVLRFAPPGAKKGGNSSTSRGFSARPDDVAGWKNRSCCRVGERVIACHVLLTRGAVTSRSRIGRCTRVCSRSSGEEITVI